ncbi:MAG TPA: hydrophobe/amphiphile efflux-3 (HAE3) family transporter [Methanoregulaceae archaeon]|nr:RND family transporter [Methanolinea sp.]MDD3091266.1 hydrophobe/amphiphile efflux-3 (HAE3) family transporter [Methanoregulaceae archaeon]MDD5048029.1 hydrophobe/amphiphile efflux-3 (HAE3) family transporter [Methanoregulaceae archaeon]HOP67002.1 hydrophobe/amphiphile efflux-3 (HAE3) family transporter [Methanoregulaceae archaeon]HPJ74164.1 hydrophobe/amphiphile efflux-3 (HAE3) family transporter [Methanoregulaceae archaeon]
MLHSPYEMLAEVINKKPIIVLAVIIGVVVAALYGMTFVSMETGSDTYLDKDTEQGMLLDKYTNTFQSDSIMLLVESDDVLNPDVLAYMDRLQGEVATQRYISGVTSIVDLFRQINGGELPSSYADIKSAKQDIPPEILDRYVPSNLMTIGVITLDPGLSQESQMTVVDNLESIISLSNPPPGVNVVVTGNPAFQKQMMDEMGVSMGTLILAAMILMVIAVGLLFSHVRYRFLSVAIVAAGLILTFGIMGYANLQINMVAIGAFPVLIGIGIDYAIQFHARLDEEARRSPLPQAIKTTITRSGPSILYAMLSTSMGFLAMQVSPVPMIGGFGVVCMIGVVCCYLMALVTVPTMALLLKYKPKANGSSDPGNSAGKHKIELYTEFLGRVAEKVARNAVPILIICALVAFIGFQTDGEIPINTDEETFVPSDMPAVINLKKVSRTMGSTSSLPIFVRGDNVISADTIEWMQQFQNYEESHNSKITGSTSIADYLAQYNGGILPASDHEIQTVLEQVPEETRERYLGGPSEAVIEFSTVDMESEVALSMVENMKQDLAWNQPPPGVSASITGMSEMFADLIEKIAQGKIRMTITAFGLIFLFLLLVYRKLGKAATPVIPIMMIVGWNGLIMYILGIDYTPLTAVLGSMTIGVASEYTILIMERVYEERSHGQDLIPAIQHGVQQIGTAITVSGMTTVFGFAALMLSTFNIVSNFGVVTVITVAFSLVGAIVVMPAILFLVGRFEHPERGDLPGTNP